MVHFRLLALGLAASTVSVALAVDFQKCAVACGIDTSKTVDDCKSHDDKSDASKAAANCVRKNCPDLATKFSKVPCSPCGSKSTLKHCQKVERRSEHEAPVGGHHLGEPAGKHDPDHKAHVGGHHPGEPAGKHDPAHKAPVGGHPAKTAGKHDPGHHPGEPAGKHDPAHKATVGGHPAKTAGKHDPDHKHKAKSAVEHDHKSKTADERGHAHDHKDKHEHGHKAEPHEHHSKHGDGTDAKRHDTPGAGHTKDFYVHAGPHKFRPVPASHDQYGNLPIPERHGEHGTKPVSEHHSEHKPTGEPEHHRKKTPVAFKPEFVLPHKPAPKSESHPPHGHDKGMPQPVGHGKTPAQATHGAHATPKEGSEKQPEKAAPKSGDKGNPSAKPAAGHAAETPKGGVKATQCHHNALKASKCGEKDLNCICTRKEYHASLMTCAAANTAAYETEVPKYVQECKHAGHPVASIPKGKQGGGEPQPGPHAEAGKKPASSNSTSQNPKEKDPAGGHPSALPTGKTGGEPHFGAHGDAGKNSAGSNSTSQNPKEKDPASGPPTALPTGKKGGEPQPGAHGDAGKNPASSNSTDQGPKDKEPASASPIDPNFPTCAKPCITVAQKKSKSNCTTPACQCTSSSYQTLFSNCAKKACNDVDWNTTMSVGAQACAATNVNLTGGDGSNNNNTNNTNPGTNPGTPSPSTPGVQESASSAFGLRSSAGAVLAGAIGVAFATLL